MKNALSAILILILSTSLVGCDSSSNDESDEPNVSGIWRLTQVSGNSLPTLAAPQDANSMTKSGSLALGDNGNYTLDVEMEDQRFSFSSIGTWNYNGEKLTLIDQSNGVQYPDNVVTANSITLHSSWGGPDSPFSMVFEK